MLVVFVGVSEELASVERDGEFGPDTSDAELVFF